VVTMRTRGQVAPATPQNVTKCPNRTNNRVTHRHLETARRIYP
jgi:hypothetical protein